MCSGTTLISSSIPVVPPVCLAAPLHAPPQAGEHARQGLGDRVRSTDKHVMVLPFFHIAAIARYGLFLCCGCNVSCLSDRLTRLRRSRRYRTRRQRIYRSSHAVGCYVDAEGRAPIRPEQCEAIYYALADARGVIAAGAGKIRACFFTGIWTDRVGTADLCHAA